LFSGEHIDNSGSANPRFHGYKLRMLCHYFTDDGCLRAKRMCPDGSQGSGGGFRRNNRQEFPFIGYVKRVKS
jgi:hypothetical protein